ncbi:MAG: hypothetical protein CMK09_05915 [Ponticaulis sp.]|nr:hypothetical protein [Ponticaulis sp.]
MNMSYTSPTIEFSLDVLNGAEFDLTSRAYGKGETERCVETPWAAQTFAKVNRVLDIGLAMSHPDYLGLMIGFLDKGGKIEGADIIKPERVKTRYPEAWRDQILDIPVHIGDVRKMDFSSDPFDAIMCISTLEHIGFDAPSDRTDTAFDRPTELADLPERSPNADRDALAAFRKALKPGGLLCLTVPAGEGATRKIQDSTGRWAAYLEYGPADWNALTSLPGFDVVTQVGAAEMDDGWRACEPFEKVYSASVGEDGFPRGCIMSVLRAV